MDRVEQYREIVIRVLQSLAAQPPSHGAIEMKLIIDRAQNEFLLLGVGWNLNRRVHSLYGHVSIRDGKVWIEQDGTEKGLAVEFVEAGIPKHDIVLAFYSPEHRKITEFAVA